MALLDKITSNVESISSFDNKFHTPQAVLRRDHYAFVIHSNNTDRSDESADKDELKTEPKFDRNRVENSKERVITE